ncbi:MAG: Hint domain-containing protein [Paracoccaceae bacterium]
MRNLRTTNSSRARPTGPGFLAGLVLPEGRSFRILHGADARIEALDSDGRVAATATLACVQAALPCFCDDTPIDTPDGPVPAGALRPGQLLLVRDGPPQPLLWVGRRSFDWRLLGLNPALRPVVIRANAIAPGLPASDVAFSPSHRIALSGTAGGLVAVGDLVGHPGVESRACQSVTYVQLLLDPGALVSAAGLWGESFHPELAVRGVLTPAERTEIRAALRRHRAGQAVGIPPSGAAPRGACNP